MVSKKKILIMAGSFFTLALLGVFGYAWAQGKSPTQLFDNQMSFVSGTEYSIGETGSTDVRVTNALGMGLSADWCNVTIYYPDKTVWVDNQLMTEGGASGSWYSDFIAPSPVGVYEQYVECKVGGRIIANSKAFHVSAPLTLVNGTLGAINETVQNMNVTIGNVNNTVNNIQNTVNEINDTLNTPQISIVS